jgi:hypothetical protein
MRRIHIFAGLAACALLVFASMPATIAAPQFKPLLQTSETEPNDGFDTANEVAVPVSVTGSIEVPPDTPADLDFFWMETDNGREYEFTLAVWNAEDVRLRMRLYNGDKGFIKSSSSTSSNTNMAWIANQGSAYVRVESVNPITYTVVAQYRLDVEQVAATPTKTATPPPGADPYEPNDTREAAYTFPVATSVSATDANFVPSASDQDWFKYYVKDGRRYRASTTNLTGVDTYLEVFDKDGNRKAGDNDSGGGFASKVEWTASYNGYYYIRVTNQVSISESDDTYDLTITEISAGATSTPAPAPTNPDADRCDRTELGNHDFDHACVISSDVSEGFSFVPPPYGGPDNDFFKIWVKPALLYECYTSNLSPGVDPNMILYDHNRNAIGGNDDRTPGDFNSYLAYYATYEGWLYILVGYGDRTPTNVSDSDYTLVCQMDATGQATATPPPGSTNTPTPTPQASTTPGSVTATSTPTREPAATSTREALTVRPLTTPTPVPATTPVPRFIPIRLLVYYDGNDDRQPGAGEGVAGISAQAYEVATNQLLAQDFTDELGNLEFTVAAHGHVRVSVPFFGFSQLVAGEGASIYLRVPPQSLPGGMP